MCADKVVDKISGSGITIGGTKTLEEYIDEERIEEISEEIRSERFSLYSKPTAKIAKGKDKNGTVRFFTRRELNKEFWEVTLMTINKSVLTNTEKLDLTILTMLLSGKKMVGSEIRDNVLSALPDCTKKSYAIRCSHLVCKTLLSKLIRVERFGNHNIYRLETAALDLTPQELHVFAYKNKDEISKALSKHKALMAYFEKSDLEPNRKSRKQRGLAAKPVPAPGKAEETEIGEPVIVPNKDEIVKSIEEIISKALGIDINISGKIEIVFKLGG